MFGIETIIMGRRFGKPIRTVIFLECSKLKLFLLLRCSMLCHVQNILLVKTNMTWLSTYSSFVLKKTRYSKYEKIGL